MLSNYYFFVLTPRPHPTSVLSSMLQSCKNCVISFAGNSLENLNIHLKERWEGKKHIFVHANPCYCVKDQVLKAWSKQKNHQKLS